MQLEFGEKKRKGLILRPYADNIDAVGAGDALGVEEGVIEEDAAEVIGEGDVGIEVEAPAVILEAGEAGVDGGAFVEVAAVLGEEVCLDADGAVFFGDGLGGEVGVGSYYDEGRDL